MNIGIDIRVLARGARTGVEEYAINLLSELLPLNKGVNYKLFYNAFRKAELNYPWLSLDNVHLKDSRIPNRFFFAVARYLNAPKIDKLLGGIDVYFNPHFFVAPVSRGCRKVITFHDLSFEHYPEFFSKRKRLWQNFLMNAKREAEKADKIIAVSKSTKADLVNLYGVDERKIEVIYSGVSERFREMSNVEKLERIKKKYNLPDKFILYFGTIEPRKNIVGIIKAFELLKKDKSLKLVIAGTKGWLYKDIFKAAQNSKYSQDIFFTGFVEDADKPFLYNLAELFVYPSFFEGFGFPPLEAMACGLPVIVSCNSSLPEVVGKAALMVDPANIDELAWAMEIALNDQELRKRIIAAGLEQAKKFSWRECAEKTMAVLGKTGAAPVAGAAPIRSKMAIDARFYGPKQKGLGRYVQKLVENLEREDVINKYFVFLRRENWDEYYPKNPNFKKVLADCRWYGFKEQFLMPWKIWREKADLTHYPHFNVPIFAPKPFVVTIHDLILKRFPTRRASTLGFFSYWFKNFAYHFVISLALRRAKKIIAISNYTKKDILKYFKVSPEKIEVVYEGGVIQTGAAPESGGLPPNIQSPSNIPNPYLLYVGNAYPHKNLERLILAFAKIKHSDLRLVLVGEMDYFYQRLQKEFSHVQGLVFTDFVSDSDLEVLYRGASLYVFPSLCEGFGLPPLEAMSYGLPVVSSNATCLPEILGDAAVYFNSENIDEMAEKIKEVLDNEALRKDLILKGYKRVKKYDWIKMARETMRVYGDFVV
ncbi:glycosyltransferase family 4 protein [Patescibacteria group bacterium]|nr:glycosyltransferase family 4 protein [Patescibacteria group bacterium]